MLRFNLKLPVAQSIAKLVYTIHGSGQIDVAVTINPKGKWVPMLPRIGMQCAIPSTHTKLSWFGRGPDESYIDRHAGTWVGNHSGRIRKLFNHYLDPQESGNRTAVRWARFHGDRGHGLRVESLGDHLLQVSAYPYTPREIELARHPIDLRPAAANTINIDLGQLGLGGTNSWGAIALPDYRLPSSKSYSYSFRLTPRL